MKQTLASSLQILFPESSKSTHKKWIKAGRILVNGKKIIDPKFETSNQDNIQLKEKKKFIEHGIEILYEDSEIVVLDKPHGLLSVATAFEKSETAHGAVKQYHKKVYPVHRLDRETSGIMVMAFTDEAREGLKTQFINHTIFRQYTAIVRGKLSGEGTWSSRLKEDSTYFVHSHPKGVIAISHFKSISLRAKTTVVELVLETGRKNQIRAQAREAGYPVLGDEKYGDSSSKRLYLHASKLSFIHPISKKPMKFHSLAPF